MRRRAQSSGAFTFTLDPSAACGQPLKFTLQIDSSLGTVSRDITLRVGQASGTGTPIVYTRTIPGGLAIPDNTPRGVTDSFTINDDLEIADLDFQVDSLTHTWTGDLGVMLKAPNGYGTDMIYHRRCFHCRPTWRDGNNFINTRIDDEATADLNQSLPAAAPIHRQLEARVQLADLEPVQRDQLWVPTRLASSAASMDRAPRVCGRCIVNDTTAADTGTLNAWSLIVTPKAFSCAAFTPGATVAGTKSFAGSTAAGSTITYTVTLTNTGTAAQADNAGDEFTDVLPAQLTLLDARANAGTAMAQPAMRKVTWNGQIPIDGVVKLTITARINAGTEGATVANQGTIAFDSDNNASNDATAVTDDPSTPAAGDPTSFVVDAVVVVGPPVIAATQAAALTTDQNGDGKVNPGDTLTYTIIVNNTGESNGLGVVFSSGLDPNTTLVVGSVTTSQNTVTSGNTAGNTQAIVALGTLQHGGSATIAFRATVKSPLPSGVTQVASQGSIAGSNFAQVLTDDPASAAPKDATVTPIQTGGIEASLVSAGCSKVGLHTRRWRSPSQVRLGLCCYYLTALQRRVDQRNYFTSGDHADSRRGPT